MAIKKANAAEPNQVVLRVGLRFAEPTVVVCSSDLSTEVRFVKTRLLEAVAIFGDDTAHGDEPQRGGSKTAFEVLNQIEALRRGKRG